MERCIFDGDQYNHGGSTRGGIGGWGWGVDAPQSASGKIPFQLKNQFFTLKCSKHAPNIKAPIQNEEIETYYRPTIGQLELVSKFISLNGGEHKEVLGRI